MNCKTSSMQCRFRIQVVCWGMLACGALALVGVAPVAAQPPQSLEIPTAPAAPVVPGAAVPGVPPVTVPGASGGLAITTDPLRYAPDPNPFIRGNRIGVGVGQSGFYFALWKLMFIGLAFIGWSFYSNWVHEDSRDLHVNPPFWNGWMLVGGLAGVWMLLTVPFFALAVPVGLGCIGGPLGLYVRERNTRVPENARVMTKEHIRSVVIRALAKVGIHLGGGALIESVVGPPIVFVGKSRTGQKDAGRSRSVENSKGYLAAKELVYDSLMRRCTDIHLEPKEDELAVRLRIDGIMYPTEPFDRVVGDAIINIFKVLSAMDITEKRRPQDGSFGAVLESREVDFRVATQGTRFGEKMSLRILDQSQSVKTLEMLGMRKQMQQQIEKIVNEPHGLFLSCGPTGAGKSTTLYAVLQGLDAYENNIITVEDPVEYKMDSVTQIEINTKAGQTFGGSLRSILRQDPDVVMIGEIRDDETAKVCCQAAATGHMVFSTVHANDTISALFRLIDLGVEPFMLSSAVSAILGQRLARRLCPHCKEAYKPNPEFLKQAGLSATKVKELFRPPKEKKNSSEKCTHCGGLGYYSRIGVFELLVINERMRELIREKAAMSVIKAEARKNGMLMMMEEGLRLVIRGVTSVEEVLRVVK